MPVSYTHLDVYKRQEYYRGVAIESNLLPKMKVEIVVCKVPVKAVVDLRFGRADS